jgi:hypothetical protein
MAGRFSYHPALHVLLEHPVLSTDGALLWLV